jgi:hypothetical protein
MKYTHKYTQLCALLRNSVNIFSILAKSPLSLVIDEHDAYNKKKGRIPPVNPKINLARKNASTSDELSTRNLIGRFHTMLDKISMTDSVN